MSSWFPHLLELDVVTTGGLLTVHDDVELLIGKVELVQVTVGLLLPRGDGSRMVNVDACQQKKTQRWSTELLVLPLFRHAEVKHASCRGHIIVTSQPIFIEYVPKNNNACTQFSET